MDGSSVSPVFPTKADLDEIRLEYVAVFIVIIILIVLALILVCVGLGCIFCTRRNSFSLSKKKDHERDTELSGKLSHGQVTLRSLSGKKEHTHAPASKAEEAPAKQQRTTPPPEYEYPMHLFHEEVSEETVVS